jgi:tetratricopeptide (TPR) repeat protein
VIVATALAVVLVGVGVALDLGSHPRQPGDTITGDAPGTAADVADQQQRALDAKAEKQLVSGDLSGALASYIGALKVDPRDVEALSYAGWLSFLAGAQKQAVPLLRTAVRTQPSYPDAHAFLGIVLLRTHRDVAHARAELRRYLRLVPSGQMSGQVRRVLAVATTTPPARGPSSR